MRLDYVRIDRWPKLAWVACVPADGETITVYHGPKVETRPQWFAGAVWDGPFDHGEIDRTDLIFGTGGKLRDGDAVFVLPGHMFGRLWSREDGRSATVSNTLPGLLAVTDLDLLDNYPDYSRDVRSMVYGLDDNVGRIPTTGGPVRFTHYRNLVWKDGHLGQEEKPDPAPHFDSFRQYRDYLRAAAERLGENCRSSSRSHPVGVLTSISSGYDSTATATIARDAGCSRAVTICESTSLWRGSDSGKRVADFLGLDCNEYPRTAESYPEETAVWAGEGRPNVLNWTQFDYDEPLCLLFTGCHGEKMWDRVSHDRPDPFARRSPASLGLCEWRLIRGVLQSPLPFWAVRHSHELHAITARDMGPWAMGDDAYDKPIARRIVEEAGVPREAFGQVNKNTSLEAPFWWPYSADAHESYCDWRAERGLPIAEAARIARIRKRAHFRHLLYLNIARPMGRKRGRPDWMRYSDASALFCWANQSLTERYRTGLGGRSPQPQPAVGDAREG
ncbi:MAG: hypothetical protein ACLFVU_08905 [Phycisphaerae bacterium]